jgi:uncharacterized protein with NAD-binding domain and iron-sulfur cluster
MKPTAVVVGSTLAGLTAALRLSQGGCAVTLIEHGEQPDRLSALQTPWDAALPLVLMGYQTATLALLETLGSAQPAGMPHRIGLELLPFHARPVRLRYAPLPAPLHVLAGLAIFGGMPVRDRWRFLMWVERTWERDPALPSDLDSQTAEAWLRGIGQSEYARTRVWTPLARFLLGDDLATVSAAALLAILMRGFFSSLRHSHLFMPLRSTDQALHRPLREALVAGGVAIEAGHVDRIEVTTQKVMGVQLSGGRILTADRYVVALPHHRVTPLLPERLLTRFAYFQQIAQLSDTPAAAVQLEFDRPIQSPRVLLLADRTFHWMYLTPASNARSTLASCILTGARAVGRPDEALLNAAAEDVQAVLPGLSDVARVTPRLLRSDRAFLTMKPGVTAQRPLESSPFPNLLLASEWTDTGLPTSAESAIVSGNRCADAILDNERPS